MIDWQKGTWQEGDKARYHQGHGHEEAYYEVHAGLYWYSGLGSGTFFRPVGTMLLNCTPQEASAEAARIGVEWRYVDSFIVSSFSGVMG
jgi:hypothetical protein